MKVKIKDWWELAENYGIDEDGDIDCYCEFVKGMKKYCGEVIEIDEDSIGRTGIFLYEGWYFDNETYEIVEE